MPATATETDGVTQTPKQVRSSGAQVVCFERLNDSSDGAEILRCVALPGRGPGLALGPDGLVHWQSAERVGCLVAVSADARVVLWRPSGTVAVWLCRAGRELSVPEERVVVMLDQDELVVGAARMRVHLHGRARRIHAPFRVRLARALSAAAVAGALGVGSAAAVSMTTGCEHEPAEAEAADAGPQPSGAVSQAASAIAPHDAGAPEDAATRADGGAPPAEPPASDAGAGQADGGATGGSSDGGTPARLAPTQTAPAPKSPQPGHGKLPKSPPIEVRDMPPFVD